MRELTEEEFKLIISEDAADYSKDIYLFLPLTVDQPLVMYTSLIRGVPAKHSLSHELKLKYSGGMYFYKPKQKQKPFDITKHEWSDEAKDCHISFNNPSWAGGDLQICIAEPSGNYADDELIKEHAIAIAKHFGLTAEDLK